MQKVSRVTLDHFVNAADAFETKSKLGVGFTDLEEDPEFCFGYHYASHLSSVRGFLAELNRAIASEDGTDSQVELK